MKEPLISTDYIPDPYLDDADTVQDYKVYSYEHLDDLSFLRSPQEVYADYPACALQVFIDAVEARLRKEGWEGDGVLRVLWFPPFVDVGVEDTAGTYIWCVKQSNNGVSWLASPVRLDFKRLAYQNESAPIETHLRAGVMYAASTECLEHLTQLRGDTKKRLEAIANIESSVYHSVCNELLVTMQGDVVALFQAFLDSCYLKILEEVLAKGNTSSLHVTKFSATLNPKEYLLNTRNYSDDDTTEENKWFTTNGLIRDIWVSYRFESFGRRRKCSSKRWTFLQIRKVTQL